MNVFEIATKEKYRFPYKGQISVEDLWDLSLTSLDNIFKTLNRQTKANQEESLLESKSKEDETLENQIAIVKHIVAMKQEEIAAQADAKANKEKREKIMAILADKKDAALKEMSVDELEKMLAEM